MSSSDYDIVCFAPSDWWAMNPSCTTHLMSQFARAHRVLYVNPFSSDLSGGGSVRKHGLGVRIRRKLGSCAKYLKQPRENLFVFSPWFLPLQGRAGIDALNNLGLASQLKLVSRLLGFEHPVLWLENVRAADALSWFRPRASVYHVSDLFADDTYVSNPRRQKAREARLSDACDLLIGVSRELYELKQPTRPNVHYLPHGVDFERFRETAERRLPLPEVADVPQPIAGYFGTMTEHNDIEMMVYCARKLPHVSFVFAGQITSGDYAELARLKNVHLLGKLSYDKIPQLCASFDVCMLQWRMCDWIRKCNPLKMMEYMASGNPIVSVEIDEAKQYKDVISIAHNPEEFCAALEWELRRDNASRRDRRVAIAAQHSWVSHAERISRWIEDIVIRKAGQ